MSEPEKKFSHTGNFTDYMAVVARHFESMPRGLRVLDLPAGNGLLADVLRAQGHQVVCADINRERPDFMYVDMSKPLPFRDGEFDAVVCLEGVEHMLDPAALIAGLTRVTRPGGTLVISTPNVMNFYSRLHFLFTGAPCQFNPGEVREVAPHELHDRGHISPLSYYQLRYLFGHFGARVEAVLGDRYKKKALMPLYLLLLPFAWLWSHTALRGGEPDYRARNREMLAHAFSAPLLFSRSLVLVLRREMGNREGAIV